MFARLVLAYVLILPTVVPLVAQAISDPEYTLLVRMSASADGQLQVFYDRGSGYTEAHSVAVPLRASERLLDYRLPLPPGRYRELRIDPGNGAGRYMIERVVILKSDGSTQTAIPVTDLVPAQQLSILERSSARLVLEAPPGSNDPNPPVLASLSDSVDALSALDYLAAGANHAVVDWRRRRGLGVPSGSLGPAPCCGVWSEPPPFSRR